MLVPLALVGALAAETPPTPLQERARVDYVLVQVSARDRDGRLVTDLGLDDFVLTENGARIRLESLDIIDLRSGAQPILEPPPAPVPSMSVRRITRSRVVFALDFQFIGYADAQVTFRELERFLGEAVGRDRLELMLYSLEGGRLMDSFTTDPQVALAALSDYRIRYRERLEKQGDRGPTKGGFGFAADLAAFERRLEDCRPLAAAEMTTQYWNCVQDTLAEFLDVQNARTDTVLRELESLATDLADGDSVATVVFVSPGFSPNPGTAAKQLADGYLGGRAPSSGKADTKGVPYPLPVETASPPAKLVSFEAEVAHLLDVCARSQVVFHTFDIYHFGFEQQRRSDAERTRLPGPSLPSYRTDLEELGHGMTEIAEETGGAFHVGAVLHDLDRVLEGTRFLYILGYTVPAGKEEGYRKIKVKCLRKGVTLAHRRGYVAQA
jgi:VWFA-related protein